MGALTLLVACVLSILVFIVRPVYGLILYVGAIAWYPSYLMVSVGTIDFTVRRIVVLALLARLLLQPEGTRRFRFILLDKLVIACFAAELLSGVFSPSSMMALLENRAGAVFDMVLPYFAVRLAIQTREQYLQLLKGVVLVAAPLGIVGLCESLTGWNPMGFLRAYENPEAGTVYFTSSERFGLIRATVGFSHSIMYGLFFAMLGPACAGLLRNTREQILCWIGLTLMGLGVFASVSSGPVLAAVLAIVFIAYFPWRQHWKTAVVVVVFMCASVEIISNRHFYDVLGDFTFSSRTAWYRSRLIDVALFEGGMSNHWLTGYGYNVDPGWGPRLDGRSYTDTVNHYILELHRFGLVGLLPFLAMNFVAAKLLRRAYMATALTADRWLIWCVAGGLFGLWNALMSVSLFGPPTTVFFMLLAFAGLLPEVLGEPAKARVNVAQAGRPTGATAARPSVSY